MMGIIKNCWFISYKSLDHLQSGIPTSGTSCIKDPDECHQSSSQAAGKQFADQRDRSPVAWLIHIAVFVNEDCSGGLPLGRHQHQGGAACEQTG